MVRSDWNQYGAADSNHSISTAKVHSGDTALEMTNSADTAEILAVSENDAPAQARIETWAAGNSNGLVNGIFRRQDANNYYHVGAYYSLDADAGVVGLTKVVDGNFSVVDEVTETSYYQDWTSSSGAGDQSYNLFRIDLWEDSAGDVRGRIEEDSDQDGSWTQLGGDVVDTSPDLPGGGGVGVGLQHDGDPGGGEWYVDDTTVFY
jgi:hypothetical protein